MTKTTIKYVLEVSNDDKKWFDYAKGEKDFVLERARLMPPVSYKYMRLSKDEIKTTRQIVKWLK
jgi:hypothetical protein